jgi:hypothetical protein
MQELGALPPGGYPQQFTSCPFSGQQLMDPIFSLMAQAPLPCALFLTPGQSYMMHAMMRRYRSVMYSVGQP